MKNISKNRSKKDLYYRKKGFFEICDILDKNKIFHFIWGGALLGFKREKNFIKWDGDIEIGLYQSDILKNWDLIIKSLIGKNFKIIFLNKEQLKIEIVKYRPKKVTKFTISGWRFDFLTQNYIRHKLNIPKYFFKNMTRIKFSNRWFMCPGPVEKFLKYIYGDWKKPFVSNDKKSYLSGMFLKKNFWIFYIYLDKIKKKILI